MCRRKLSEQQAAHRVGRLSMCRAVKVASKGRSFGPSLLVARQDLYLRICKAPAARQSTLFPLTRQPSTQMQHVRYARCQLLLNAPAIHPR